MRSEWKDGRLMRKVSHSRYWSQLAPEANMFLSLVTLVWAYFGLFLQSGSGFTVWISRSVEHSWFMLICRFSCIDLGPLRRLFLVGGLEHLLFSHILGMSSSQLTNSYFSEGWRRTTKQYMSLRGFSSNLDCTVSLTFGLICSCTRLDPAESRQGLPQRRGGDSGWIMSQSANRIYLEIPNPENPKKNQGFSVLACFFSEPNASWHQTPQSPKAFGFEKHLNVQGIFSGSEVWGEQSEAAY